MKGGKNGKSCQKYYKRSSNSWQKEEEGGSVRMGILAHFGPKKLHLKNRRNLLKLALVITFQQ